MKKTMEQQLKEIMGIDEEQHGVKGLPEELKNIKITIRNFIKIIKILIVFIIIGMVSAFAWCIIGLINYSVEPSPEVVNEIGESIILLIASAAFLAIALICKKIFVEIDKCGTPFIPQVSKGMRKIAAVICIMFFVEGAESILYPVFTGTEPKLYIDGTDFIFVSVLMLLSYIFDYGCKLQKESDETL